MELKVHIEQTIRIVCGLSEDTTVHEIILALAQALKQTGRFYLVECWSGAFRTGTKWARNGLNSSSNNRARVMSPSERPIRILKSYGSLLDSSPDDLEFHLVRTSTTNNPICSKTSLIDKKSPNLHSLLGDINRQQYLLNEQSARYKIQLFFLLSSIITFLLLY